MEHLRLALEAGELGTWDWDLGTGEVGGSERCYALFGLEPHVSVDSDIFLAAVHPDDRERVNRSVRAVLEQSLDCQIEFRSIWPDGSTHWIAARGSVHRDQATSRVCMTGIAFDI